jgi:hypothetical protein
MNTKNIIDVKLVIVLAYIEAAISEAFNCAQLK